MLLIAIRKGGVKCSSACPFYTETGVVRGINGPLQTHCRMTMNPWMVDCDIYNPMCLDKLEVTEEQWKAMQKAVHKRAIRQRKLYPEENENGRPVGSTWTQGRWNAQKSKNVKN
jgi:hypothetical protein